MPRMGSLFKIWMLLFLAACASAESVDEPEPIDDGWGDPTQDAGPDGSGSDDASGKDAAATCLGIVCNTPPTKTCEDADNLRIYEGEGSCAEGVCEYPSTVVPCPYGCEAGACSPNPCQGVTCNGPPPNECVDATTIRAYSPNGTCGKDGCKYTAQLKACAHGCKDGACKDDPCANVTCSTPPDNECTSASYLRSYHATGTCAEGSCGYAYDDIYCKFGCENDVCNGDPCLGVKCETPKANHCQDSFNLVVYAAKGTCNQGECSYSQHTEYCAYGCDDDIGQCKANPCLGVKCEQPNANYCLDAGTLRKFAPKGTCSVETGACSYEYEDEECPCAQGVCKDCIADTDCEAGKFCYDFACRPCQADIACGDSCTDCTTSGDVCNASSGTCAECVSDGHCAAGSQCSDGACEVCKTADACGSSCAPCGETTPHCLGEGMTGQCVECRSDADCSNGKSCNPTTNTCGVGPLCQAALDSAANSLASSNGWTHARMDGVTGTWNYDYWQYGKATSGPGSCHSGGSCWATNLTGNYINCQRADLRTPAMNLSACAGEAEDIKLVFWHWHDFWTGQWPSGGTNRYDGGLVELSGNNGTSWVAVPASDANYSGTTNINPNMNQGFSTYACNNPNSFYVHNKAGYVGQSGGWKRVEVTIPPALRTSQLRVRFAYASGVSSQYTQQDPSPTRAAPGWYIDGVTIAAP